MLTLNFKNLRDELPLPNNRISFYVVAENTIRCATGLHADGEMRTGKTFYDWVGVGDEEGCSCCYDYNDSEQNEHDVGDVVEFESGGYYQKVLMLEVEGCSWSDHIAPFNNDDPSAEEDEEIFWEYTHKIKYNLMSSTQLGSKSFPSGFIKELMEEGKLQLVGEPAVKERVQEWDGYKYNHLTLQFGWLGNLWEVKGTGRKGGHLSEIDVYCVENLGKIEEE